jgi:hypothetical protein
MNKHLLVSTIPFLLVLLAGCGSDSAVLAGALPVVSLSASSLAFPNTVVGSVGNSLSVTVMNTGKGVLNPVSTSISGSGAADFMVSSTTCSITVAPTSSCAIVVTFTPATTASYTATLNLADNATGSPQTVSLSGTGIPLPRTNSCTTPQTTSPTLPSPTANYAGVAFTGTVKAGSLGVIGASVQIYAAGTTGNGSTPVAIGSALTTDSNGHFSVPAATYPYSNSVVYAVSTGGKAGASGTVNAGTVLMSVLGVANGLTSNGSYTVNEATTVASAYAMAQFMKPGAKIGATATNASGIGLAAGTVANLVNITTGALPGTYFPSTGTAPTARINSLANLLNACIVSTGATSSACTGLYSDTTVSGVVPANTLDAVLALAKNPGTDVSQIYTLSQASSAYSPALGAQPSDWTMFVSYTGSGMNDPSVVGVDSLGNLWVGNYFNVFSYFSNTGKPILPNGSAGNEVEETYGGTVDVNNNFWTVNEQSCGCFNSGYGSIEAFNASATLVGQQGGGGLDFPLAAAFDTSGVLWVVDYGDSAVSLFNNTLVPASTTPTAGSPYKSSQLVFPVAVAMDAECNAFVANQASNTITKVMGDGSSFTSFAVGSGPSGVAVDEADNVWSANYYGNSVGLLTATGQTLSGGGITGGGLNHPQGIAIDGNGTAWVANYRGPSISELAAATSATPGAVLSPSAGWGPDAQLLEAFAISIDASGNLWVTNFGNNTLTEFVGMAAPVKTPLLGPVRVP